MLLRVQFMIERILDDLRQTERGQAMVEYALILALVSIAAVAILTPLGDKISSLLSTVSSSL